MQKLFLYTQKYAACVCVFKKKKIKGRKHHTFITVQLKNSEELIIHCLSSLILTSTEQTIAVECVFVLYPCLSKYRGCRSEFGADRLGFRIEVNTMFATLATDTGGFNSTERHAEVTDEPAVDPDISNLHL